MSQKIHSAKEARYILDNQHRFSWITKDLVNQAIAYRSSPEGRAEVEKTVQKRTVAANRIKKGFVEEGKREIRQAKSFINDMKESDGSLVIKAGTALTQQFNPSNLIKETNAFYNNMQEFFGGIWDYIKA